MQPQTTTQSQNSQHPPMTSDRAKAALGNATLLQSFLLPAHTPESKQAHMVKTGQAQPQPQGDAETPKTDTPKEEKKEDLGAKMTEMQLEMTKQLDAMRQEMKQDQTKEMDLIKQQLKDALNG